MTTFDDSKINISETVSSPTELKINRIDLILPSIAEIEFEDDVGGFRTIKLQNATGSEFIQLMNKGDFSSTPMAQSVMDFVIGYGLISGSSETSGSSTGSATGSNDPLTLNFVDNADGTYVLSISGSATSSTVQAMITTQTNGNAAFYTGSTTGSGTGSGTGSYSEPAGFTTLIEDDFNTDLSAWTFVGGGGSPGVGEASVSGGLLVFRYGLEEGTVQSATATTTVLESSALAVDGAYFNSGTALYLEITSGSGAGQEITTTGYVGSTRTVQHAAWTSVNGSWVTPDSSSTYAIRYRGGTEPDRVKLDSPHGPWQYHRDEKVVMSANWYGNSVNKWRYFQDDNGNDLAYIDFHADDYGPVELRLTTQNEVPGGQDNIGFGDPRNQSPASQSAYIITRGEENLLETLWYPGTPSGSDGVCQVKLNGVLIIDVRNLNHPGDRIGPPGQEIGAVRLAPVWGGGGSRRVPEEQTITCDKTVVSYGPAPTLWS